ncbi:MAG TPA: 50S ribosomal protein L6 [Bacillota bacterium]|jgi:large subunit ribosomal protein L6
MSRVGRLPVKIPAGVDVAINGATVTVKGPKGQLTRTFHRDMKIDREGDTVIVSRPSDERPHRALHGLTRTLLQNMVSGVTKGFERSLQIEGTGYRAAKTGNKLTLALGFSHPVEVDPPAGITIDVPNTSSIIIRGSDKELVGETAAKIRAIREPEPYKGKGIRYLGEHVRHKAGKAGKK